MHNYGKASDDPIVKVSSDLSEFTSRELKTSAQIYYPDGQCFLQYKVLFKSLPSVVTDNFEWPWTATIANEKSKHLKQSYFQIKNGWFVVPTNQILVLSKAVDLQLRLFAIAHTIKNGYRSCVATISVLLSRIT